MHSCREKRNKGRTRTSAVLFNATVLLLLMLCLCACNFNSSSDGSLEQRAVSWPQGGLLNMLPVGSSDCFSSTEDDDFADVKFLADRSEFNSYVEKCPQAGFTVDERVHENSYCAYNEEGYRINIIFLIKAMILRMSLPL